MEGEASQQAQHGLNIGGVSFSGGGKEFVSGRLSGGNPGGEICGLTPSDEPGSAFGVGALPPERGEVDGNTGGIRGLRGKPGSLATGVVRGRTPGGRDEEREGEGA